MTNPIEKATTAGLLTDMNDNQAIAYLAALETLDYDRQRTKAAKQLNVQVKTLDTLIYKTRKELTKKDEADDSVIFPRVDMYHEEVDGEQLLNRIEAACKRHVICDQTTRTAVSLWITLTWLIDYVECLPIANITAPEKNCGKSTLLSFIGALAFQSLTTSNITSAALFRSIEKWQPTLLIDEADSFADDNEAIRGIINAGHTKGSAHTIRCDGDDNEPKLFSVWGAKAIAGIGKRAGTIESRSIDLRLRRKGPHEQTDRMKKGKSEFAIIQQHLARWTNDIGEKVRGLEPELPEQLQNRDADNWEPLLIIAECAGGRWPELARNAALELTRVDNSMSVAQELLTDIQTIFEEKQVKQIFTSDLLEALLNIEDGPWLTYNRGKSLTARQLSKQLSGFGIKPGTKRIGAVTKKGYSVDDFSDSFARYLTPSFLSVTPSQVSKNVAFKDFKSVTSLSSVTDDKTSQPSKNIGCDGVTDKTMDDDAPGTWSEAI
jgi:putative DNA primase/helicase